MKSGLNSSYSSANAVQNQTLTMYFFWIKKFTIVLVSIVTLVLALDERFKTFLAETRKGYALGLPVFKTFSDTNGILDCTALCLRLSLCMYFNYQISVDRGICEVFKGLHVQNSTQLQGVLVTRAGFAFVQAISKVRLIKIIVP